MPGKLKTPLLAALLHAAPSTLLAGIVEATRSTPPPVQSLIPPPTVFAPVDPVNAWIFAASAIMILVSVAVCRRRVSKPAPPPQSGSSPR
jgi:hypothetical protein